MVSIKKNLEIWDSKEHWDQGVKGNGQSLNHGEKWSLAWGGSDDQWNVTLYPRLHRLLPAENVLEIGAGHGRWSEYLLAFSKQLYLVDLSGNCLDFCRKRFASFDQVSYHKTGGAILDGIEDNSIDFIFSFDSLVHADREVIESYIFEIKRVLKQDGHAFIHHSNYLQYMEEGYEYSHMRDPTVSAELFRDYCKKAGIACLLQELVPWSMENLNDNKFIDAFSLLCLTTQTEETIVKHNQLFIQEQGAANFIHQYYGSE